MWENTLKASLKNIYWGFYGLTISNPGMPNNVQSILFVCKGNICRSPFAEKIALRNFNKTVPLNILSVGIHVDQPKPPPDEAITAAKHFGINISEHRSRSLTYALMESFDVIAVMEAWQYRYLKKIFQEFKDKIYLLPLFENRNHRKRGDKYSHYNIKDPYGKSVSEFIECYERITKCLDQLLPNNNNEFSNRSVEDRK